MVEGLERFREHFRGFEPAFVLIGGTACDLWMSNQGLRFRKTKDLDIVLVIEALDVAFGQRFQAFLEAGQYEQRQRQKAGKKEFYDLIRAARYEPDGVPVVGVTGLIPLKARAFLDMRRFLALFPEGSVEWPAIRAALKGAGGGVPTPADLLAAVRTYFA